MLFKKKNPTASIKIIQSMNLKWKHFPDVININPTIWKALLYLFQHILMQFITHTLLEMVLNWVAQEVFQVDFFLIVTLCAFNANSCLQKLLKFWQLISPCSSSLHYWITQHHLLFNSKQFLPFRPKHRMENLNTDNFSKLWRSK